MMPFQVQPIYMFLTYFVLIKQIVAASIFHDDFQCVEVNNPNNVAFETLQAYKANKISFDPMKADYAGNYVEIMEKLPNLTKDMFVTYESNFIIKLALSQREVRTIQPEAFLGLTCLHYLRLRKNKIAQISSEMFEGLDNLLELSLDNNRLTEIPQNVFRYLISLQTIDLSNNKLSNIDSSQFKLLPSLINLDLSYNNLNSIPDGAFSELNRLFKLDLSYNQLQNVPVESWEHLDTLKSFILTGNMLSTFNLESSYEYKSLVYLYLDSNRFNQLNIQHIKLRYPKLLLLELQDNPWNCDDLYGMVNVLNITKMTYVHKNSTDTNINGLDCIDYSLRTTELPSNPNITPDSSSDAMDSTTECNNWRHNNDGSTCEDSVVYETVQSIKSISLCILLLVILLLAFDFIVRGGILENISRCIGCRDYRMMDSDNAESISLLNTRSRLQY